MRLVFFFFFFEVSVCVCATQNIGINAHARTLTCALIRDQKQSQSETCPKCICVYIDGSTTKSHIKILLHEYIDKLRLFMRVACVVPLSHTLYIPIYRFYYKFAVLFCWTACTRHMHLYIRMRKWLSLVFITTFVYECAEFSSTLKMSCMLYSVQLYTCIFLFVCLFVVVSVRARFRCTHRTWKMIGIFIESLLL